MIDLVLWLLLLEALGLLAFPPAFLLLGRLPDRGSAVTRARRTSRRTCGSGS